MKKKEETKFDYVVLDNITRCGLLGTGLRVHDLDGQYSPGQFSGFPAKMNYSASPCVLSCFTCHFSLSHADVSYSGGKARAPTIMTDHDFAIIRGAILQKSRRTCQVSVSFDTDDMEGFRIKRQVTDSITERF